MEANFYMHALTIAMASFPLIIFFCAISVYLLLPLRTKLRLHRNGLNGPPPSFPLGNLTEMSKGKDDQLTISAFSSASMVTHDIHSLVFPYFASWTKTYGKVFVYWLGTEPFLYVADPEFIKQATSGLLSKKWGKPSLFKHDRKAMFGNGLVMTEGDEWFLHRNILTPAFSLTNLNAMTDMIAETTSKMLEKWKQNMRMGENEIEMEEEMVKNAAEIIGKVTFGSTNDQDVKMLLKKLQEVQIKLFNTNRLVGVPLSNYLLHPKKRRETKRLGKEIDQLLHSMIDFRTSQGNQNIHRRDLLSLLLATNETVDTSGKSSVKRNKLSRELLVDECKTFFFAGHETTALALTWSMLMLSLYPQWQDILRQEIAEVTQGEALDAAMLPKLKKMELVLNEVLRLYGPAPNAQRQAREDVQVGNIVIPKGTNMWVDVVGMHHDESLWGKDVYEFKPERFEHGGCKHRLGFAPFGFGSRLCIGKNLMLQEYKIVLSGILKSYAMSVSPKYVHSPRYMLTLRPSHGVPLVLHPLY